MIKIFAPLLLAMNLCNAAKPSVEPLCEAIRENWKSIEAYHQGVQYGSPKINALATLASFKKDCNADHLVQLSSHQVHDFEKTLEKAVKLSPNKVFLEFAIPCIELCSFSSAKNALDEVRPDSSLVLAHKKLLLKNIGMVPPRMYPALGLRGSEAKHILDSLGIKPESIGEGHYLDLTGDSTVRSSIISEIRNTKNYADLSSIIYSYVDCHDKQVQRELVNLWKSDVMVVIPIPSGGRERHHIRMELANAYQKLFGNKKQYECALEVTRNDLWGGAFRNCNLRLKPGIPTPEEQAFWLHLTKSWEIFFEKCVGIKADLTVPDRFAFFEDEENTPPPYICTAPIE